MLETIRRWWNEGGTPGQKQKIAHAAEWVTSLPLVSYVYDGVYSRVIKRKARGMPSTLAIETCNTCNLRCIMCSYPEMKEPKGEMDPQLFRKLVDEAADMGVKRLMLQVLNEPLQDRQLFERIEYAAGKGMTVLFSTNGTLLSGAMIERILRSPLGELHISFDSATKEIYERIRLGANFERTVANIRELIRRRAEQGGQHPRIVISAVLQKENLSEFRGGLGPLKKLFPGADHYTLAEVFSRAVNKDRYMAPMYFKSKHRRAYACSLLWREMVALTDGTQALCCEHVEPSKGIGNLKEHSLREAWNSPFLQEIRRLHLEGRAREIPFCRNCEILDAMQLSWWSPDISGDN